MVNRISFRIFVKGGWGGGGEDNSNTPNALSLARNIIELIDFLKLGGSGGMLPQENF